MLVEHFLSNICGMEEVPLKSIAPSAVERLCDYSWPGNVRQLENAIEAGVALSGDRDMLEPADFPLPQSNKARPISASAIPMIPVPDGGLDYEHTVALIERSILAQALQKTGGNKKAAADMLNLKRTTLSAKIRTLEAAALN
jgi:DNA-binding NtrC family response regulator